jgi:hypothetical protein
MSLGGAATTFGRAGRADCREGRKLEAVANQKSPPNAVTPAAATAGLATGGNDLSHRR